VEFHWQSRLLLVINMRWSYLICNNTSSQLAYLMIHGMSGIVGMMPQCALKHLSVANLRRIGNMTPDLHFAVRQITKHNFSASWYTRDSLAYILSHIMTAPAQYIVHCHLAIKLFRQYWVLVLQYETWLSNLSQSHIMCWQINEAELHGRVLGTDHYH